MAFDLWGSVTDAGGLKNDGLDLGSFSKDLFGSNVLTDSFDKIVNFGSVASSVEQQKKDAEAEKKKREAETAKINQESTWRNMYDNLSSQVQQQTKGIDTKFIYGGVVAVVVLIFAFFSRGK